MVGVCAGLLDRWYDLATVIPGELYALESNLTTLEWGVRKAKDPKEAISMLTKATLLTALPLRVAAGLVPIRRHMAYLGRALEAPLRIPQVLNLTFPNKGASGGSSDRMRLVQAALGRLVELDVEATMGEWERNFGDAEALAGIAIIGARSIIQLAKDVEDKEVGFVKDGKCEVERCLPSLGELGGLDQAC